MERNKERVQVRVRVRVAKQQAGERTSGMIYSHTRPVNITLSSAAPVSWINSHVVPELLASALGSPGAGRARNSRQGRLHFN